MYHCYGRRIQVGSAPSIARARARCGLILAVRAPQETGHKTLGHICVTEDDKRTAADAKGSLLYGELLPRGVNKARCQAFARPPIGDSRSLYARAPARRRLSARSI